MEETAFKLVLPDRLRLERAEELLEEIDEHETSARKKQSEGQTGQQQQQQERRLSTGLSLQP